MNANCLNSNDSFVERLHIDRRKKSVKSFLWSLSKGRRVKARRSEEATDFYTDVYDIRAGLNVIAISLFSALDAFLTLQILERGGKEVNPVMLSLLEINNRTFVAGKMAITSAGLLFILVHINFKALKIIPIRLILNAITTLYLFLVGYELFLLLNI